MESEGYIIQDGENYSSKEIGIKQISLEQYRRCAIEGSKNIINDPVQREIYVNAVKSMEIIVFPDILLHPDIQERISNNEKKISALESEYKQHLQKIRSENKDGNKYSTEKLQNHYETRLIQLMQEKLVIIGLLLKKLNYYGEWSIDV